MQLPIDITPLHELKRGARARVMEVDYTDPQLVAKLAARGLVPGAEILLIRGGDPLLLSVDEARWAISMAEAKQVYVEAPSQKRRSFFSRFKLS